MEKYFGSKVNEEWNYLEKINFVFNFCFKHVTKVISHQKAMAMVQEVVHWPTLE